MLWVVALGAMGCRDLPRAPQRPCPPDLPRTDRVLLPPDVSRVSADEDAGSISPPGETYRRLTAEECCALACEQASVAYLIAVTVASDPAPRCNLGGSGDADRLRKVTAGHMAAEARAQTASAALALYYQLLEAELLTDVLGRTQQEVDELVRANRVVVEAGVPETDAMLQLRKRQIELRVDRAKLQVGIGRLNTELAALTGLYPLEGRILPADQIAVVPDPLDRAAAVRVGLASRHDLWLIRDLLAGLNSGTVGAVRQAVAELVPPLGAITATTTRVVAPSLRAVLPFLENPDVEAARRQLTAALEGRERDAAKEIEAAVQEWIGQRAIVGITRRRVEAASERVRELTVRKDAGAAVEAEYRTAVLDHLAAEADQVREAVKWKQADVKARLAMGLLCGGPAGDCH